MLRNTKILEILPTEIKLKFTQNTALKYNVTLKCVNDKVNCPIIMILSEKNNVTIVEIRGKFESRLL